MSSFTLNALKRIARSTRSFEKTPPIRFRTPSGAQIQWFGKIFQTTSTITAMSGSTLGNGNGSMYLIDPSAYSLSAMSGVTGIVLLSMFSTTIASGTWVGCILMDGQWVIIVVAC